MSTYVFKAIDLAGGKARGEVEADSKQAVSDQLKQRGLIVLDIADKHSSREIQLGFLKSVKASELAVFSRQLSTMISSGMSILRALYVLEEQTESKFLKETIVAVRKDVEAGLSLSDSMARHPKVFNTLFVAMAQAGGGGGPAARRAGAAPPKVLNPAVRRDGAGGGDRRRARGRPHARRRPAPERRRAAPADQSGNDLSDARGRLRRRRDDGPGRLPRARLRGRLQAVRRRTPQAHPGLGADVGNRPRLLVADVHRGGHRGDQLHQVEENDVGPPAVGPLPPARADEDRLDRPAGRRRALVAHAVLADGCGRAAAAGPGDHRTYRRERGHRRSDGRGDRLGQARRHDRRAVGPGADLPPERSTHGPRRG